MTDRDSFLAAIREHPGDDTPRLVYADWLDEHGEAEQACDQRLAVALRRVLAEPERDDPRLEYAGICENYGRVARAEFIRVQCELAKRLTPGDLHPGCSCKRPSCRVCRDINPLRFSSQGLLDIHAHDWIGPAADKRIEAWEGYGECVLLDPASVNSRLAMRVVFRRGFIDEIRVPDLAALMGTPCSRCDGRGHELVPTYDPVRETTCPHCGGPLVNRDGTGVGPPGKWCQRCWAVTAARHSGYREAPCDHCSGVGRVGGCRAVLRAEPVTKVVVGTREPDPILHAGVTQFCWHTSRRPWRSSSLPMELWAKLEGGHEEGEGPERWQIYPTADLAHAALSAACLRWARSPG